MNAGKLSHGNLVNPLKKMRHTGAGRYPDHYKIPTPVGQGLGFAALRTLLIRHQLSMIDAVPRFLPLQGGG
jgi:hypothetical protein